MKVVGKDQIMKTLITLAVYNERENLPELLTEILSVVPEGDILIVDDNSPDGTGVWAEEFSQIHARVKVMHRSGKLGLGSAVIDAMKFAIENGYDFMVNMDADFSHQPSYLPQMLQTMYQSDSSVAVVIGSRYVSGGGVQGWPVVRRLMSRGVNAYARFMLGLPVRDTSGSFRCYRVEILKQLDFSQIQSRGYSFFEEVLWHIKRCCDKIYGKSSPHFIEIPILFIDRVRGKSKINKYEAINALRILFLQGVVNWLGASLYTLCNRAMQTATIVYTIILIVLLVSPDPYFLLHGVPDPHTEASKFPTFTHSCVFILLGLMWEISYFRFLSTKSTDICQNTTDSESLKPRRRWPIPAKWTAWIIILIFSAFFEAVQIFIPSRTFDYLDVLQNVTGCLTGLVTMWILWDAWLFVLNCFVRLIKRL